MEQENDIVVPHSLETFLAKHFAGAVKRYAPFQKMLRTYHVVDMYHFRKGLERVYDDEIEQIKSAALKKWGSVFVERAMSNGGIRGWCLRRTIDELLDKNVEKKK